MPTYRRDLEWYVLLVTATGAVEEIYSRVSPAPIRYIHKMPRSSKGKQTLTQESSRPAVLPSQTPASDQNMEHGSAHRPLMVSLVPDPLEAMKEINSRLLGSDRHAPAMHTVKTVGWMQGD